jgi:hypothetical protein
MDKKPRSGSGTNIPDHISESLETRFFGKIPVRYPVLKFFDTDADPGIFLSLDPGSGMEKIRIRDIGTSSPHKVSLSQKVRKRGNIGQRSARLREASSK